MFVIVVILFKEAVSIVARAVIRVFIKLFITLSIVSSLAFTLLLALALTVTFSFLSITSAAPTLLYSLYRGRFRLA